jgi:hypothetical protein
MPELLIAGPCGPAFAAWNSASANAGQASKVPRKIRPRRFSCGIIPQIPLDIEPPSAALDLVLAQ